MEILKHGELLRMAENANFDVIVTADQGILYQQNMQGRKIAIVALSNNDLEIVVAHAAQIAAAINAAQVGSFIMVDIGS